MLTNNNADEEIKTCEEIQRVDRRPPGRGLPPYFPRRVSYLIMTASTKAPL